MPGVRRRIFRPFWICILTFLALWAGQIGYVLYLRSREPRIYRLASGEECRIWRIRTSLEFLPVIGLVMANFDEGFVGEVTHKGRVWCWGFDLMGDYPPEELVLVEKEDGATAFNHVKGFEVSSLGLGDRN